MKMQKLEMQNTGRGEAWWIVYFQMNNWKWYRNQQQIIAEQSDDSDLGWADVYHTQEFLGVLSFLQVYFIQAFR